MLHTEKQYGRIKIDVHRAWSDNRLQALSTEEYRDLCRMRPAVEGLMEKLKPKTGRGRTMFLPLLRVRARITLQATILNFRSYLQWVRFHFFRPFDRRYLEPIGLKPVQRYAA